MSEEPNTKIYFDGKIVRVVFKEDVERKVYWVDTTDFHSSYRLHLYHLYLHYPLTPGVARILLPIEEWLKENNMNYVEDDMVLFAMRWL